MVFLRIVHNIVRCTLAVSYIMVTVRNISAKLDTITFVQDEFFSVIYNLHRTFCNSKNSIVPCKWGSEFQWQSLSISR